LHTILRFGAEDPHARIIGAIEALGAVLLLLTLGIAFVIHAVRGEWRGDLLVYVAGVLLVALHERAAAESQAPLSGAARPS
jgi:hypothetical protein